MSSYLSLLTVTIISNYYNLSTEPFASFPYLPLLSALDSLIARLIEDRVWSQDHALDGNQHLHKPTKNSVNNIRYNITLYIHQHEQHLVHSAQTNICQNSAAHTNKNNICQNSAAHTNKNICQNSTAHTNKNNICQNSAAHTKNIC